MTLFFWLTAHSVLQDLRSEGVTVAARVIGVDNKPKRVQIRLAQGPASGLEADLGDYAGMYPDVNVGDPMLVTYDPKDIRRSLDQRWVRNPPPNLPAYGASAMSLFFLAGTVVAMLRRHRLVRMHDTATPPPPATPLTKP
ncbi:hypothetical protein [Streptomyces sp. NPDC007914]|uniref:hypothetical protein n=1 Tax=unclassified Streptomyces TaxID=2593676 RepID=UPI0036E40B6D